MGLCFCIGRRAFDTVLVAAFALLSLCVTARIGLAPRDPADGVGVIFAPWTSREIALQRAVGAGGRFVRFGGLAFVVVVIPEDPDYLVRIVADGALLVVDPRALAACIPPSSDSTRNDKS